jgi:hypothetical protein
MSDVPSFTSFNPHSVPYQFRVIRDIRRRFDYSVGSHEVLLSGSVGSAKSVLMAHVAVSHCIENEEARFLLGRMTMPDLKETIFQTVIDHLEEDFEQGVDYEVNQTKAKIVFSNGSEIISRSWADKKFKKFRSLKLSGVAIEELTENGEDYRHFYPEVMMRLGRLPHVKENILITATNPDAPSHWAYKHFITSEVKTRHVYYSVTEDNPFLPSQYIAQLKRDLDPKMARRMLHGEWLEITSEILYHSYDRSYNFRKQAYEIDPRYPIRIAHDFNIGYGKPMSAVAFQYLAHLDQFHFFQEFVVEGANTEEIMEEIGGRGLLDHPCSYIVHGDASGGNNDTRSKTTDYQIIRKYLSNYRSETRGAISFEIQVPKSNPPIRTRHNTVNGYFKNSLGAHRSFVYATCPVLDEGCRLTKLKLGGSYIEDDTPAYQHITTAAGYGIMSTLTNVNRKAQGTVQL